MALEGTMVMEIQPISSCSEEDRMEGACRRTVSSKVRYTGELMLKVLTKTITKGCYVCLQFLYEAGCWVWGWLRDRY